MSLFSEQDFSPTAFSPRWFAIKCRRNMLLNRRESIVAVLESGVLFREDSAAVEQALEADRLVDGQRGLFTRGEQVLAVLAGTVAATVLPIHSAVSRRGVCLRLCLYAGCVAAVRTTHRLLVRSTLPDLLYALLSYTVLSRRTLVCLKEYRILKKEMASLSTMVDSASALLLRQHGALASLMMRGHLALLANVPWLRDDSIDADLITENVSDADLVRVHHTLLVIQSTFLKQVAMAHMAQPKLTRKIYQNHNERLYWLHTHLVQHLYEEVRDSHLVLERVYRMLKNFGNNNTNNVVKKIGINNSWMYSEVHADVAKANIDLKICCNNCNKLDVFLDDCGMKRGIFDIDALDKDLDRLIEGVTNCLTTLQGSQMKLKMIHNRLNPTEHRPSLAIEESTTSKDNNTGILVIEDKDPETKDEVFYCLKTEDDDNKYDSSVDVSTAPGKKERENTSIVLGELKRKLVKREDMMRQRENAALEKTMPELKGKLPFFPRQIRTEEGTVPAKGFISKIRRNKLKKRLKKSLKTRRNVQRIKAMKVKLKVNMLANMDNNLWQRLELNCKCTTNSKINTPLDIMTLTVENKEYIVTRWLEPVSMNMFDRPSTDYSDLEPIDPKNQKMMQMAMEHSFNVAVMNYHSKTEKSSKLQEDLNTPSPDSDLEVYQQRKEQLALMKNIKRHRVARKKTRPSSLEVDSNDSDLTDDGLRPVEHRFGAGMALASVVQGRLNSNRPNVGAEEVFIGDGEVSEDSGNDER